MSNSAAPFPKLRTAYLRAIARAWRDDAYAKELFRLSATPEGVLPHLEHEYNFKFPFRVTFAIVDGDRQPTYEPIGTRGWFGFGDEFVIPLPKEPAERAKQADALALYCQHFPSLLGEATDDVSEAPPDFAAFGVITARILALAWRDEKFKCALFAQDDARNLVQGAMNYVVLWNFRLKFREVDVQASPDPVRWVGGPGALIESQELRSKITVYLPRKPDPSVEACALAAYNDTGSQYPFTCG